jgi:hypothetical protein
LIEAVDLIASWPASRTFQLAKSSKKRAGSQEISLNFLFFFRKSPTHFLRPLLSNSVTWRWPEVVADANHVRPLENTSDVFSRMFKMVFVLKAEEIKRMLIRFC